jgi:hypothetical protein
MTAQPIVSEKNSESAFHPRSSAADIFFTARPGLSTFDD